MTYLSDQVSVMLYSHPPTARTMLHAEFRSLRRPHQLVHSAWLMWPLPDGRTGVTARRRFPHPVTAERHHQVALRQGLVSWPGTPDNDLLAVWAEMHGMLTSGDRDPHVWLMLARLGHHLRPTMASEGAPEALSIMRILEGKRKVHWPLIESLVSAQRAEVPAPHFDRDLIDAPPVKPPLDPFDIGDGWGMVT